MLHATRTMEDSRVSWVGLFILAFLVVLTRLPYLHVVIVDGDESTFLLMAQSVLDGHLPYAQIWDNKGPVGVLAYVLTLAGFREHLIGLRIVGAVLVLLIGWQTTSIAARFVGTRMAVGAGCLFIVASAALPSGQALLMEYIGLPFVLGALQVLLSPRQSLGSATLAGALVACAALVRMNLAVVAIGLGGVFALQVVLGERQSPLRDLFAYVGGGVAVVVLLSIPYVLAGESGLFIQAVFLAPLGRASDSPGLGAQARMMAYTLLGWSDGVGARNAALWVAGAVWMPAALGLVSFIRRAWSSSTIELRQWLLGLVTATGATALSIFLTGNLFPHHFLQLLPFGAVLAMGAYAAAIRRRQGLLVAAVLCVGLLGMLQVPARQYSRVISERLAGKQSVEPAFGVAQYIGPRCQPSCRIFLMNDYIVYWLLRARTDLPTRFGHLSTLLSKSAYIGQSGVAPSPLQELQRIFQVPPQFFVKRATTSYTDDPGIHQFFEDVLRDQYALASVIGDRQIYAVKR